jgi:hypothetical protein
MCLVCKSSASRNCMIAGDRARVTTEFGFKAKCPMCLAYKRSASRNCMIACDRIRVASSNIEAVRPLFLRVRKGAEGALINIHTNEGG